MQFRHVCFWRILLCLLSQHQVAHEHTHTAANACAHIGRHIYGVIQVLFNAVSSEMSPAAADKLLSRKRKLKEKPTKIFLLQQYLPINLPRYMLQRQQDFENVLFNNAAEFLLNPAWSDGNLSRSQKPNCQMLWLRQRRSTSKADGGIICRH